MYVWLVSFFYVVFFSLPLSLSLSIQVEYRGTLDTSFQLFVNVGILLGK